MVYNKNFLTRVVLRLDFNEPVIISNIDAYAANIASVFPNKEEKENIGGSLGFDLKNGEVQNDTKNFASWLFSDKGKTKVLEANGRFIYIEYNSYKDSSELLVDLKAVIIPFLKLFEIKVLSRVGLRYVNEIDLSENNSSNWAPYINSKLMSGLSFAQDNNKRVARLMGQLYFKEEIGNIIFNFGLWNPDFPNEILRKIFILDYDCFTKFGVEAGKMEETIVVYNKYVEDLFEFSITEDLRSKMNE